MGFGFFLLLGSLPILIPAINLIKAYNEDNLELAAKQVESFKNDILEFEENECKYNKSNTFVFEGKISVFWENEENFQKITFRFKNQNQIDYISLLLNSTYEISIIATYIDTYHIFLDNNSKFILFSITNY